MRIGPHAPPYSLPELRLMLNIRCNELMNESARRFHSPLSAGQFQVIATIHHCNGMGAMHWSQSLWKRLLYAEFHLGISNMP
jgi:hypothetical protein